MRKALTIAGSDSSGGAGIQADIKTMTLNGVFATSAITALTAQNTTGVFDILEASPEFLEEELDAVFTDIFPDAVKIGMVSSKKLIEVIAKKIIYYKAKNIVVDPVMVATSGAKLLQDDAIESLKNKLFPLADILTPNIPEAEIIIEKSIKTTEDMEKAAQEISKKYGSATLIKGGHLINDANDYLYSDGRGSWFYGKRINTNNTHGTGCTLSSAIASNLAKGFDMEKSVKMAKDYLSKALADGIDLGKGQGPMNHAFDIKASYKELA
ncbi:MAG: bifunctional hydroxymethylpyrimidine kinase/phosphomethylpyrimidine kinase [Peptoniphilaceae bacterium]|nr:bifunctional hydroxymethylpyrimidine kinase/phosphomethylpyrimidine kinase [Peptoniphilaceae bacterium]